VTSGCWPRYIFTQDIVSFIFGEKGLIADATWEGSRFKKLDVE
jgi:hypothetical protein